MFKKIHFKLTLLNTAVIVLFILFMSSIVYVFMERVLIRGVNQSLRYAAIQVEDLQQIPELPELIFRENGSKRNLNDKNRGSLLKESLQIKYILRDSNNIILTSSENKFDIDEQTKSFGNQVLLNNEAQTITTEINGEMVQIYSKPFLNNNQHGVVQVYRSIEFERDFLRNLITGLSIFGLIGTSLALGAGWFLAGRALVPINKSWQQQKDFVADASHELRTPLTVIQTNLEVALSNPEGTVKDNLKWLNNAYLESQRMGKLVNDLLFLAKYDVQQVQFERKNFNFSQMAKEVSEKMKPIFQNHQLEFTQSIENGLILYGDEERVRQLLLILLDNAIKYTPIEGNVFLGIQKNQESIQVIVKDSGIGISEEDKEKIFYRFYRGDKARSRGMGGTGLGLSIASWIIESHKGSIKVESQLGKGSSFIVEFPINKN